MAIEMQVAGMSVDPLTGLPILILRDLQGNNPLPIWVGLIEATAIATELEKIELARPMTHSLLMSILEQLDARITHVEITALRQNTYYAAVVLEHGGQTIVFDARPSDAIALALRACCKIMVEDEVLRQAHEIDLRPRAGLPAKQDEESYEDFLAGLSDDDFGKWKM